MPFKYSTPGRICLFGEHQDYLGLPVIAAAISRRIRLWGTKRTDSQVIINLPNVNRVDFFSMNDLKYRHERDYFKSGIVVLKAAGFEFNSGFDVEVDGNIPINSGTSSSSALLVSWIAFLAENCENPQKLRPSEIAEFAYKAEVLEFGEPGGMMDHYSTAIGHLIYLESQPKINVEELKPKLGTFVLGDSLEPKDTIGILGFVKNGMLEIIRRIKEFNPEFNLHNVDSQSIGIYQNVFAEDEFLLLKANIDDRDILRAALSRIRTGTLTDVELGNLLNQHQRNLREFKKISTPKIDKMIESALHAGALGAKINGSGGGGCMFAYAPQNSEVVAEAIEKVGGKAYIIEIDKGLSMDN